MVVRERLIRAYKRVLVEDHYLLEVDANEQSITHRYAMYLHEEFPDYDVDCEFNRNGIDQKRLEGFVRQRRAMKDSDNALVYPDIIIHHRGTNDNFIIIEAKKTSTVDRHARDSCACDECKLCFYKAQLAYRHAYFVVFPVGAALSNFSDSDLAENIREIGVP